MTVYRSMFARKPSGGFSASFEPPDDDEEDAVEASAADFDEPEEPDDYYGNLES